MVVKVVRLTQIWASIVWKSIFKPFVAVLEYFQQRYTCLVPILPSTLQSTWQRCEQEAQQGENAAAPELSGTQVIIVIQ